jgi:hypothetical protein
MSYPPTPDACLSRLQDRLRRAQAVTPALLSELMALACVRFAGPGGVAKAGVAQLIRSGAWTDAVLALVDFELPQWKLRRLVHDGGAWHCSFSKQRTLPPGLDEVAEASHEILPLAVMIAFAEALRRDPAAIEPWSQTVPPVRTADDFFVCCDNFA